MTRAARASLVAVLILVFALGALTLYTFTEARGAEAKHPPTGTFVEVAGARLHVVERGVGPPVVLLHGNPGFVQDWSAVMDLLAERHRTIAVDRPGHGYSSRPAGSATTPSDQARLLHEALRRMGVERPVIVGHSWGGGLALAYALDYPNDVAGLVLLGTRAFEQKGGGGVYGLARTPVVGDIFRYALLLPVGRPMVADGLTRAYAPDSAAAGHVAEARSLWLRPGQVSATVWDSRRLNEQAAVTSERYAQISVPVIVMVGEHDDPDAESRPLAAAIPGSRLEVLPGTGHQIPHTRPAAVVAAVEEILSAAGSIRP